MNVSFFRISSSRESTQRFSATFPCLIPIPYGQREERVVRQLGRPVGRGDTDEDGVVPHQRVGPALVEGEQRVREAVRHDLPRCS